MTAFYVIKLRYKQPDHPVEYVHFATVGETINWGMAIMTIESIESMDGSMVLERLEDGKILTYALPKKE